MQLFRFESRVAADGDTFNLADPKGRVSSFFIWNEGTDKPFLFSKPKAVAQPRIRFAEVVVSDYLEANIGVPIFSERTRQVLASALSNDMAFYECSVECEGKALSFYLGKVLRYLPLVDEAKSEFRVLTDGQKVLSIAAYRSDNLPEFYIARDINHRERLVVSDFFVDKCKAMGLNIDFAPPI